MTTFKDVRLGAAITVKVTSGAKSNKVAGVLDDGTLKVQVTAPPEGGQANAALTALLAETFGLQPEQVEIIAGHASERKLVSLVGISATEVDAKVLTAKKTKPKVAAKPRPKAKKKTKAKAKPKAKAKK
ncbi:MAG: DUF167 family protein [Anaerolineales bacterium]|nr:DUF167 family protein [Anaerolineales bacterium]